MFLNVISQRKRHEKSYKKIVSKYKKIDVLINNAGSSLLP